MKFLLSLFRRKPGFASGQAECQRLRRPFKANSDCTKILDALEGGKKLTALNAFQLTGAMGADRRFREVRDYLKQQGIAVQSRTFTSKKGGRVKQFWLDQKDLPKRGQK